MADVRTDVSHEMLASSKVIHWGAVLGGSFAAIGAWMFLLALGAAIQSSPGLNAWTAIYNLISPIIALFLGGLVASRSRYLSTRFDGALHGVVIWGFTMFLGALVTNFFGIVFLSSARAGVQVPAGFSWAIAGSILGSLIAALLGTASHQHVAREERQVPREVNP